MKKRPAALRSLVLIATMVSFFTFVGQAESIETGMPRIQVLQELGEPSSAMARGNIEILSYRNGAKITLTDGVVTEAIGLPPSNAEEASAQPEKIEVPPSQTEPATIPTPANDDIALIEEQEAASQVAMGQTANLEQTLSQLTGPMPPEMESHLPPPHQNQFSKLIVGLFLHTLITLLALKLSSKYWGYEILWGGIIIVAIVDTVIRTGITMGTKYLLGFPTTFYADEAIAALVMVVLVQKTSTSRSLNQAIQITLTTKVFTIVAGSFLVTMLLSAIS